MLDCECEVLALAYGANKLALAISGGPLSLMSGALVQRLDHGVAHVGCRLAQSVDALLDCWEKPFALWAVVSQEVDDLLGAIIRRQPVYAVAWAALASLRARIDGWSLCSYSCVGSYAISSSVELWGRSPVDYLAALSMPKAKLMP